MNIEMCGFPDYLPPDHDYWRWEKEQEENEHEEFFNLNPNV